MDIRSLGKTDFPTLFKAFNQAFADYELQISDVEFQAMLKRRGFHPDLSFAAFDGDRIVAFTLNGVGHFKGVPTAYDTGTGTLKEYRGKGLATKIFEYSIPYLKEQNIQQYLLEVLQHNTKAVSVYRNLGFEVVREFNYFRQENKEVCQKVRTAVLPYSVERIDPDQLLSVSAFWDFYPSWQNSFDSIRRVSSEFINLGVFNEGKLIGYCIFEPASGDITQIAVDKENRRKGIATLLLQEVIRLNRYHTVKVINTDITCHSITHFLEAGNIGLKGKQFEMIKKL